MKHGVSALFVAVLTSAAVSGLANAKMPAAVADQLSEFERTGELETCLPLRRINQLEALSDDVFLVRTGANGYYLNEVKGRCNGATRSSNRIQYSTSLSQLCKLQIITIVENTNGFTVGSCSLGDFERLEKIQQAEQ